MGWNSRIRIEEGRGNASHEVGVLVDDAARSEALVGVGGSASVGGGGGALDGSSDDRGDGSESSDEEGGEGNHCE